MVALWEAPGVVVLFEADLLEPEGPSPAATRVSETFHLEKFYNSSQHLGRPARWTIHLGSSGEMTLANRVLEAQRNFLKKMTHITTRGHLTTAVLEKVRSFRREGCAGAYAVARRMELPASRSAAPLNFST